MDLSLRLLMYLRTQCRNESLRIKIYKNTNPIFILRKKTHKIRHSHIVQLASWRKLDPRCSYPREQIN